jgi:cell division septation protein DedD
MSTYRLSLSLKSGIALLSGFAFLAVLVFFGGVVVGFSAQEQVAEAPAAATVAAPVLTAAAACPVETAPKVLAAETSKFTSNVAQLEPLPRPEIVPVSEAEPPVGDEPEAPAVPVNRYAVQIGAFRQESNARNMIALLRTRGYDAVVVPERVKGEMLRSVRLSESEEWDRAWAMAKDFTAREQMDAMVVLATSN